MSSCAFRQTATIFIFVLAVFCDGQFVAGQVAVERNAPSFASIRVMSYNIHHGRGGDDQVDLERIAKVIASAQPDIVAIQEVDDRTQRTNLVDQTEVLAKLVGMQGLFVHQIDFEGGRYGQAILCRFPMTDLQLHWLPGTPERERRMAGSVNVSLGSRDILFVTTHLHHANDSIRELQAKHLNQVFAFGDSPARTVVLAGDLNAVPESETLRILADRWKSATSGRKDALTFPASAPGRQLDYVLYRSNSNIEVGEANVIDEAMASDHRPLLVELLFKD